MNHVIMANHAFDMKNKLSGHDLHGNNVASFKSCFLLILYGISFNEDVLWYIINSQFNLYTVQIFHTDGGVDVIHNIC